MFAHGATIVRTPLVRTNGISMVVNIALQRTNRKHLMRKRIWVGGAKCNNETEIGKDGDRRGGDR